METKPNMQKGISKLLMRIFAVLIIIVVSLSFYVCNTPKVLAEEQELKLEFEHHIYPVEELIDMETKLEQEMYKEPEVPEKQKLMHDLWYVEGLLCKITTTAYSEELHGEVVKVLNETEGILEDYPNSIPNIHAYYNEQREKLERYDAAITGATEKLETLKISKDMDISQVMGFTADEITQVLLNARNKHGELLVTDVEFAKELANGIVELVKKYPANEMFIIGIMGFETTHFTSRALVEDHNYAGDMTKKGKIIHYESNDEGISKAVEYIYKNIIATGPTIRDVNMRYCEIDDPPEEETEQEKEERIYRWANKVVGTMKMYSKIER